MLRLAQISAIALTISLLPATARAEIVYSLGVGGDPSTIGQTTFNAIAGSSILIDIYATQRGQVELIPGLFASDLRLSQGAIPTGTAAGAGSYWVDASVLNSDGTPSIMVRPDAAFQFGPGFIDDTNTGLTAPNALKASAFATTSISSGIIIPVTATNPSAYLVGMDTPGTIQENSVLLGTMQLNVAAGTTGTFTLQFDSPDEQFLLGDSISAGPFITLPSLTATVAVPEPSHLALMGVVACGFGYRQRRKAKHVKETQPQA